MRPELDREFMKNCGTCGAPVTDAVAKCFKCGSPITAAGDEGPKLMRKFGRGRTVHRVAGGLDKRRPVRRKKPAHATAVRKRRAAEGGDASAEEQQLAQVAGGSEGDMAARILRDLIDKGAIGDEKRKSAEKLVGELGGSLPPPRRKAVPKKRPRQATRKPPAEPTPEAADPQLARLKELEALRDSGVLTEAEFTTLKQQIID